MFGMKRSGSKGSSPIFIVGSYRSATSVMTWALGQHPNIFPLEETHFIYKLAIDLDYLYEIGSRQSVRSFIGLAQITPQEFRTHFGQACNSLIESSRQRIIQHAYSEKFREKRTANIALRHSWREPKRRWVDGTPENSHYVLPLLRLYPDAKFIHILRNPRSVATSLMHFSTAGAHDYAEENAYRAWISLVSASANAENALGQNRVMRVRYEDIVSAPESTLRRCLAFVGERYSSACLNPLKEKLNNSHYDDIGDSSIQANINSPKAWVREAFELYRQLEEGRTSTPGRLSAIRTLYLKMREYQRNLRPDENERLSTALANLEGERNSARVRLKVLETPLEILDWGPQDIVAGESFNVQPNGERALWIRTRHAPLDTVVELGGICLDSAVHGDGGLVTASVPSELTHQPGQLELILRSVETGEIAGPLLCTISLPILTRLPAGS